MRHREAWKRSQEDGYYTQGEEQPGVVEGGGFKEVEGQLLCALGKACYWPELPSWAGPPGRPTRWGWGVLQTPFPVGAEGVGRRSARASKHGYPAARITITIGMRTETPRGP